MINQTSAGIVLFQNVSAEKLFLLLNYPQGHWDFVKGKIEKMKHYMKLQEEKQKRRLEFLILNS